LELDSVVYVDKSCFEFAVCSGVPTSNTAFGNKLG